MANRRKDDDSLPLIDRIEQYIAAHPRCAAADIVAGTGVSPNTVNMNLTRLRLHGRIRRVIGKERGRRTVRLEPGIEEGVILQDAAEGQPKQVTVSHWEPPRVAPQSWAAALGL